jgi:peptidoglycan LD-endopeptidase LytH
MVIPPNPFPASLQQGKPETTPQLGQQGLEQRLHDRPKLRSWAMFSVAATGLFATQTASAAGLQAGPIQTQAAPVQPLVNQTVNTQIVIPAAPQTSLVITPRIAANAALPTPDTTAVVVEAGDLDEDGSTPSVQVGIGTSTLEWKCPVPGAKFTNDWGQSRSGGRSHTGTDMLAPRGTPVLAPFSGTAVQKSSSRGGLSIYLKAPDGMQIFGAHLSSYGTAGKVKAGTIIGYVGNTGNASGAAPHLHLEIHPKKGAKTNPYPVLKKVCG